MLITTTAREREREFKREGRGEENTRSEKARFATLAKRWALTKGGTGRGKGIER